MVDMEPHSVDRLSRGSLKSKTERLTTNGMFPP